MLDKKLNGIIDEYWKDFNEKQKNDSLKKYIVNPSIPIIWFGNLEKYMSINNKKRIVTVALNPSDIEFKNKRDEREFNIKIRFTDSKSAKLSNKNLYKVLNNYFEKNPYSQWFRNFEHILNLLDSTYGGKMTPDGNSCKNIAVHIDIFSAIATNPTWGKLSKETRQKLSKNKEKLFDKLLEYLKPDIILVSVAKKTVEDIFNIKADTPNYSKCYVTQAGVEKKSIKVIAYRKKIFDDKDTVIVYGRNFGGTVFGGMSDTWKKDNVPCIVENCPK